MGPVMGSTATYLIIMGLSRPGWSPIDSVQIIKPPPIGYGLIAVVGFVSTIGAPNF